MSKTDTLWLDQEAQINESLLVKRQQERTKKVNLLNTGSIVFAVICVAFIVWRRRTRFK